MSKLAIGIMSGTSLDGIDIVIANIDGHSEDTKVRILAFDTFKYDDSLLVKIKECLNGYMVAPALICSINFELAYAYSDAVKKSCLKHGFRLDDVDFIASHGQTIYHINDPINGYVRSSLQLGDGAVIANQCKTTVVSNFRTADIAVGGKGAPLVPFADYILFKDITKNRSLHNIGGIANMTIIDKESSLDDVYAFDSGPGNMMIDYACKKYYKIEFDQDGEIARKGIVINELLEELLTNDYLKQSPPKSTGREMFGDEYTEGILHMYHENRPEDVIRTLTEFTKDTIVNSYKDFILPLTKIDEIIFSGGGAYNKFLLESIKKDLPQIKIFALEDIGYNSSSKEALAFIILGNETLHHSSSNVLKATGAKEKVILGQVNYVLK
ncbi:anhydro-N-acetylmuramic acid kinase AnmK [Candidatus Izimaplasma bacterium]|nr:anhydro-N-acetylmuramic acid kinase AnmK [Candidatus Izimaplasma bacterium]